jgi:hypothetical protein
MGDSRQSSRSERVLAETRVLVAATNRAIRGARHRANQAGRSTKVKPRQPGAFSRMILDRPDGERTPDKRPVAVD